MSEGGFAAVNQTAARQAICFGRLRLEESPNSVGQCAG